MRTANDIDATGIALLRAIAERQYLFWAESSIKGLRLGEWIAPEPDRVTDTGAEWLFQDMPGDVAKVVFEAPMSGFRVHMEIPRWRIITERGASMRVRMDATYILEPHVTSSIERF